MKERARKYLSDVVGPSSPVKSPLFLSLSLYPLSFILTLSFRFLSHMAVITLV